MHDIERVQEAIRGQWIGLFMDGRNKHGTHLLTVPPDGLCLTEKGYEELLDSNSDDVERVFSEAEAAGYTVGCRIIVTCSASEDEGGYYYELNEIDDDLTRLIFGSADEQIRGIPVCLLDA